MATVLRRPIWRFLLALLVLVAFSPTVGAAGTPDYALPDGSGHFYQQANGQGGQGDSGFAITNDDGLPFWMAYQQLGGPAVLGYPISGRFVWDGFTVQAMQKVILQWQPDTKTLHGDILESWRSYPDTFQG